MKKIILALALLLMVMGSADARMSGVMLSGAGTITEGSANNAVDMSRGFEIVETERADTSLWEETDTGSLLDDVDSVQAHSGSNSMSVLGNDTTLAHQRYDTGATKTDVSISCWFYAPSSTGGDDLPRIIQFGASTTGTYGMHVDYRKSSSKYYFAGRGAGDIVNGTTEITPNAWYRIEIDYTQNDTSTVQIYSAAGSLIDTISITASNNASRYLFIGKLAATATNTWGTFYFDELGIDYTDATTPLSPFTVAD